MCVYYYMYFIKFEQSVWLIKLVTHEYFGRIVGAYKCNLIQVNQIFTKI